PPGRIGIHSSRSCLRKKRTELLFHLFRTEPSCIQVTTSAGYTALRKGHVITTIMAPQLFADPVIGKAHVTARALRSMSTGITLHHRRIPPAVLEQDNLLSFRNGFFYLLYQAIGKVAFHPLL